MDRDSFLTKIEQRELEEKNYKEWLKGKITENIPITVFYYGRALFRLYWYFNSMSFEEFDEILQDLIQKEIEFVHKFNYHKTGVRIGRKFFRIEFFCFYYREGKCTLEGKTITKRIWKPHYLDCTNPHACNFSIVYVFEES
jgi:hypothetical protein